MNETLLALNDVISTLLTVALWSLIYFVTVLVLYIIVMAAHGKWGRTLPVKIAAWIFILLFDVPCNLIVMTIWFLEAPKEWTVTGRLKRWRKQYEYRPFTDLNGCEQRRLLFAVNFCDRVLDRYDTITGDHC